MDARTLSPDTLRLKRGQALAWLADHPGPHTVQAVQMALEVTGEQLRVILDTPAFRVGYGVVVLTETGELALPAAVRFAE